MKQTNLQQTNQGKKEQNLFIRTRNGSGDITNNLAEIKMIVRIYYKKLYTKTLVNPGKIIKFLEIHKLQEKQKI